MKKIVSFFLSILFIYSSCGFYFLQLRYLDNCHIFQSENVKNGPVSRLCLPLNSYERVGDNEIRYRGKMYDVVRETKKDDVTVFDVFSDEKEDNILASINLQLETHNYSASKNTNNSGKSVVKTIDKYFSATIIHWGLKAEPIVKKTVNNSHINITDPFIPCFSPPPWMS